jgi:protein SCO1/2
MPSTPAWRRRVPETVPTLLAVTALLLLAACASRTSSSSEQASASASTTWHGTVPGTRTARPSFILTDTAGRPFDFATATRGRPTLLFSGYTNCPDVCPTTMADIAAAKARVAPRVRDSLAVIFVTVDPVRDTPTVLRRWLNQFDSSFVGLTGSRSQLEAAQHAVGIPLAVVPAAPGPSYNVLHATQVAGYGVDDRLHVLYFAKATVADYAADLPELADVR